jgi:division/cell wall cluster transcriptional repressor MraZ
VAELLGTHSYQLDPKGRISLPGRFREAFADGAVLTLGQDGCLFCFPRAEWTARAAEVRDLPLSDTEGRAYARMFFGKAESVTLDGQGRLLVPQRLRGEAGHRQGGGRPGRLRPDGDLGPRRTRALRGRARGRVPGRDARTRGPVVTVRDASIEGGVVGNETLRTEVARACRCSC